LTEYVVIPLRKLISSLSPERIAEILSSFPCRKDEDLEYFLREMAVMYEKKHLARTSLIFERGSYTRPIAYFTIAVSSMDASGLDCDNTLRKKMNIHNNVAQSYLIGQLGKRDGAPRGLGEFAISCAIDLIKDANEKVGCRLLRLECKKALIEYYKKSGFILIGFDDEKDLYEMIKILV